MRYILGYVQLKQMLYLFKYPGNLCIFNPLHISVGDAEALPNGREADPTGGHVRGELLFAEGRAAQQARDRGEGVARDDAEPGGHLKEREGARPRRTLHKLHPRLHRHQAGKPFSRL